MTYILNGIKTYWLALTAAIIIPITILSLYPLPSLPPVPGSDKTHHFIAYATLVFPVSLAKPKLWPLIILGLLVYSGFIELVQPYFNRYGEWKDLGANAIGLGAGMTLAFILNALTQNQQRSKTPS